MIRRIERRAWLLCDMYQDFSGMSIWHSILAQIIVTVVVTIVLSLLILLASVNMMLFTCADYGLIAFCVLLMVYAIIYPRRRGDR